jgi:hypothetical protein
MENFCDSKQFASTELARGEMLSGFSRPEALLLALLLLPGLRHNS